VIAGAAVSAPPDEPERAVRKALSFDRRSTSEPPLSCYVFATCAGSAASTLQIWHIARLRSGRNITVIHVLVRTAEGGVLTPVPGVTVTLAGRHKTTDNDGDTVFFARLTRKRTYRITATRSGTNPAVQKLLAR
jgi:hypothetical protein